MSETQQKLDYADEVALWFAKLGNGHIDRGELEEGLKYTHIAASIRCRQNRTLSTPDLETNLCNAAARLPGCHPLRRPALAENVSVGGCLHVLTEALPAGGVTAMAMRWIAHDRSRRQHHVALLAQRAPVPEPLAEAVQQKNGIVHLADPADSFIARAAWLRNLANDVASLVVLHVDVSDVIAGAAFGINGGPRVLLVNHNAHIHWTGASVADLLVNCRGSALEGVWAAEHRGVSRYATVPIPLPDEPVAAGLQAIDRQERSEVRKRWGLPSDAIVMLTAGAFFKYLPTDSMDFVRTCERILQELPNGVLLAAGFNGDKRWQGASQRTGARIRTLGRLSQEELTALHAVSDIYLEAFPFGTTTSLLESALHGTPVVLAPATCPPPYGSDGVALDNVLKRPSTSEDYVHRVLHLARNAVDRERDGRAIQQSVREHHAGDGWRRHLAEALQSLPLEHATYLLDTVRPTPIEVHEHWAKFVPRWSWNYEETLDNSLVYALEHGLKPRLNREIKRSCRNARNIRAGRCIPLSLLVVFMNYMAPLLSPQRARSGLRFLRFMSHGSAMQRLSNRVARILKLKDKPRSAYEEFR